MLTGSSRAALATLGVFLEYNAFFRPWDDGVVFFAAGARWSFGTNRSTIMIR